MSVPPGVIGDGMVAVRVITTFAGTLTAAAFNAGTDITCYMTPDGFNRQLNQDSIVDDRLCSTQSGEEPGRYAETLALMYIWHPQDTVPAENEAYNTLVPGSKKFLAVRYGLAYNAAGVAGQFVDVVAFTAGQYGRIPPAKNEKLKTSQKLFIPAGGVTYDLALT